MAIDMKAGDGDEEAAGLDTSRVVGDVGDADDGGGSVRRGGDCGDETR
jgi:hypothetical protein